MDSIAEQGVIVAKFVQDCHKLMGAMAVAATPREAIELARRAGFEVLEVG